MPTCDIIMPVYNNATVLSQTLAALASQTIPTPWRCRLIVSDDGSVDASVAIATGQPFSPAWDKPLILTNSHHGAAFARNAGLDVSTADIVFFLGADIILRPGCLAAHLTFHEKFPQVYAAALGWVKWDPRLTLSPLMEWMTHGGPQNAFDTLLGQSHVDASRYFYGSHVSLKRAFIAGERFNTAFVHYGWEDSEFGYRLSARGLTLQPLPQAISLHAHAYTFKAVRQNQYWMGYNAVQYQRLQPKAKHILPPHTHLTQLKYAVLNRSGIPAVLAAILRFTEQKYSTPRFFAKATGLYFWKGVFDSQKHRK